MDSNIARARLEELAGELERSAAVLEHGNGSAAGESTTLDQHPADSGSNLADADREEASLEVLRAQLERVRMALGRVDAGTYGQCVECGRELPDARLEVRPEAERCVDCQQRAESRR